MKLKFLSRKALIISLVVAVSFAAAVFKWHRHQLATTLIRSRIWVVYTDITSLSESQLTNAIGNIPEYWREVTPIEYSNIVTMVTNRNSFETLSYDFWARQYRLSLRRNNGKLEYVLRCLGPDGVMGTKDDSFVENGKDAGPWSDVR
jgi:hypothetical protein